jgi:hypothetical protein
MGVLLHGLPNDSMFKILFSQRETEEKDKSSSLNATIADWPVQDQLLATIVDLLSLANYQRGGGKGSKPKLLTAGPRKSARPAEGVDVRQLLDRLAPQSQQDEGATE